MEATSGAVVKGTRRAVDAAVDLHRVRAARAEDRPATRQDAADLRDAELGGQALERALPAVAEAEELVAVLLDALADDAADDGVEAGAVAAAREDSDAHVDHHALSAKPRSARAPGAARVWAKRFQEEPPNL